MLRIESSLPPRRFIPLETAIENHALKLRASQIYAVDEERRKNELQWAVPDSVKTGAAISIAKNEAAISSTIAGIRKAQLSALVPIPLS